MTPLLAIAATIHKLETGPRPRPKSDPVRLLRYSARIAYDAYWQLLVDEGWAIASHISMSSLMALFPFLIVLASLAGFIGSKELADAAAQLMLEAWPQEVAAPIAAEVQSVLTTARGGVLTFGAVFAVYFSSSGIESLRIGLNRAYGVNEARPLWLLRLESIAYVLVGAGVLLAFGFLVVLGPFLFGAMTRHLPWLEPFGWIVNFARYAIASLVLVVTLLVVHLWLPYGRRRLREVAPGVIATLILWLVTGEAFGRYLANFAWSYVSTYAGLASAMIALVFLYWTALIFIYGAELNAAIMRGNKPA
jgi:membrane protein